MPSSFYTLDDVVNELQEIKRLLAPVSRVFDAILSFFYFLCAIVIGIISWLGYQSSAFKIHRLAPGEGIALLVLGFVLVFALLGGAYWMCRKRGKKENRSQPK